MSFKPVLFQDLGGGDIIYIFFTLAILFYGNLYKSKPKISEYNVGCTETIDKAKERQQLDNMVIKSMSMVYISI